MIPRRRNLARAVRVLGVLFVLTGCAGLLAEQCFEKMLTGLVGASTPAAAIVLSVYFLGLTLGSLTYGWWLSGRWPPLRAYAMLEGGVAIWALLLALAAGRGVEWFVPLLRLGADGFWSLQALRFVVACVWILPPTFLMGASFPAIVNALEEMRVPQPRRAMSRFYALNLAGAFLGALLGPYVFFPALGLRGTLLLTCGVDAAAGLAALGLAARRARARTVAAGTASAGAPEAPAGERIPFLLAVGLFSGFLFFGLEVVWTHLIGAVLGNSIYAFAAMLALVLAGLGIGGALSTRLLREERPISGGALGAMLLAGSLLLAWQFTLWPRIPNEFIRWGGGLTTFAQGEMLRWAQAARLLLPPAIVFGMVYPALFRMEAFPLRRRARHAAALGAMNSVGCVLGALLTGFFLIPALGSEATLILFGTLALAAGVLVALAHDRGWRRAGVAAAGLALVFVWSNRPAWDRLALTSGGHVYFKPAFVGPATRLLYLQEDTLGGITTVVENPRSSGPGSTRTLLSNGKFQASDSGERLAQTGFALVPILHSTGRDDALVIGLGSGQTAEVVSRMGFRRIDVAEIAPGIVEAADAYFDHINGKVLRRPGVRLRLEDGRNHLLLTDRAYDLIAIEISSIWFAGSTSLYCEEFFELTRRRLRPGGVLQQWVQVHHLGMDEIGSIVATMRRVYPHVSFWLVGGQGILVASVEPQRLQPGSLEAAVRTNPWRENSPLATSERLVSLLCSRLLSSADVDRFLASRPFRVNTDANRYLEYATPRYNLDPRPLDAMNRNTLALFARFEGQEVAPGPASEVSDLLIRVTPERQREVLGLRRPSPGSP